MIIVNKLILICKKEDKDIIKGVGNLVKNDNSEIDLTIINKIPKEIISFSEKFNGRFDNIIEDILEVKSLYPNDNDEELNEIYNECKSFINKEEWKWIIKAVELKIKYGEYRSDKYFQLKTGVNENCLKGDSGLPANNEKQFSFYTKDNPPLLWVAELSKIFPTIEFDIHYKEKSQLKYIKQTYKSGKIINYKG